MLSFPGLFHRAISGSGSASCSWAISKHPDHFSAELARVTGASPQEIEDPAKRVEYLRKLDANAITKGSAKIADNTVSQIT